MWETWSLDAVAVDVGSATDLVSLASAFVAQAFKSKMGKIVSRLKHMASKRKVETVYAWVAGRIIACAAHRQIALGHPVLRAEWEGHRRKRKRKRKVETSSDAVASVQRRKRGEKRMRHRRR